MSNVQTYYHFKVDFQNVIQHTGGTWLIHGTKQRKDNQLHSLKVYEKFVNCINFVFLVSLNIKIQDDHRRSY